MSCRATDMVQAHIVQWLGKGRWAPSLSSIRSTAATLLQTELVDAGSASYLWEVTVVAGHRKVHLSGLVVHEDPRVDRVLVEVAVRATSHRVEVHQVVKVGDFTPLPTLHHVGHLEDLLRTCHRYTTVTYTYTIDTRLSHTHISWRRRWLISKSSFSRVGRIHDTCSQLIVKSHSFHTHGGTFDLP